MKARKTTLAILAVAAVTVPSVTASTASWNEAEWVHGEAVGTDSMICEADDDFDAAASGRFLSGELVGLDLDTVASLQGMDLTLAGGSLAVDPPGAQNLGATPPTYAYANPLVLGVIGDVVTLDLTGLGVGLPVGSAGAVNQYALVSGFGDTAGAAGLVNDSGAVMVTPTTPDDELPDPATITLAPLLTSILGPGVVDAVDLEVGAVASSSVLDGCEALASQVWGDGSVTGSARDYGIASLGLNVDAPVVGDLVSTVNAGVGTIGTAVDSLLGSSGLISNAILADLELALPGLLDTAVSGNVSLSGLDLPGAVSTLLTTPLTDGVVTVDLQGGTVDVDLDALLGSLNEQAPNTELVLNDTVLNPIITRVGGLLDAWTTQIVNALTQELRDATLTVGLSAAVRVPAIEVLNATIAYTGTVGAVLDGSANFTIDAEAAGLVELINPILAGLGLPTVDDLLNVVTGLSSTLVTSVANVITTTAVGAITTVGSQLATVATTVVSLLSSIVDALPNVVSLMVNVQPDQPGAPPGSGYLPGTDASTPEYKVSALRIGLADALDPGNIAHVLFATSTAGPVSR